MWGEVDLALELAVGVRQLARSGDELREPLGVEDARVGACFRLVAEGLVRVDEVAGDGEVGVDGLAGDQQVHDLRGALEDAVDAQVAQDLFGGDGLLAAGPEGLGGLEAAAAADLDEFVGDEPGHLGGVELGEGALDADVVAVLVGHLGGQVEDGLQGEGRGRDEGDLGADGFVVGDGLAPLFAGRGPLAGDLQAPLAGGDAGGRQGEAAGVESGQGDLEALALLADEVRGRDADLVEAGDAVLDAAQAHEGVAVLDGDAGRVGLDDEGGDAALVALGLRDAGHDDEEVGHHAVGGPQLHSVEDVVVPVGYGGGGEAGRVGADVRFGEEEGADVGAGAPGQELLLLLLGAEQLERLGYADRLVGGEQYADRGARGADEGECLVVVHLGEAEAAVLGVDLHAEGAEFLEAGHDVVGDAGLAFDEGSVDLGLAEVAEPGQERLAAAGVLLGGHGVGVDEVEPEPAEEQFLGEAGLAPVLLAGGLRHLAGLALGDDGLGGRCGHQAHLVVNRDLGGRMVTDGCYPIVCT
ncbi:hypothetical protein RKD19_002425 [Streptomyces canus]